MNRFRLIVGAVAALGLVAAGSALAVDLGDTAMDTLTTYLHDNRLPLVEARSITDDSGHQSVLLYGFVATDYGKRDAEDQARDFLDDPDVHIVNRIKITPELLALGNNSGSGNAAADPDAAQSPDAVDDDLASVQTQDLPDDLGDAQEYADQERNDELLMTNGAAIGGVPLAMVLIGSSSVFPPVLSPVLPMAPTMVFFPVRPVIVYGSPRPPYGHFPAPGYFPPAPGFVAGPAPRFPATGGFSPFAATAHGFGGFSHGFGGFGGFHGGRR
jgi:hypothetical protein